MGYCYQEGDGVEKDEKEAFRLYHAAAEQGYAKAQYNLGELYNCGQGIKQDRRESLRWYKKAAEQDHDKAKEKILDITSNGGSNRNTSESSDDESSISSYQRNQKGDDCSFTTSSIASDSAIRM